MYESHFGMQGRPFDGGIAQDVDVFLGSQQQAIIGRFKLALAVPDSVVTLTGPAGVGKTTIASAAVRAMSTRLALAWVSAVPTNATELLELLLIELGMNAHRTTRIERLQMWRQFSSEMSATDSRVFVIAECTEDLAPGVLRALDSLTATDANGGAGVNVVLLGRPGLEQRLAEPEFDSLRQRIRLRQKLEPFSAAELANYLRHRVESAGGDFERIFGPASAAAVYRYSRGIARVANTLCDAALGVAAADHKASLTPELITQVASDLLGLAESDTAPAIPKTPPAPATAAPAPAAVDLTPAKAPLITVSVAATPAPIAPPPSTASSPAPAHPAVATVVTPVVAPPPTGPAPVARATPPPSPAPSRAPTSMPPVPPPAPAAAAVAPAVPPAPARVTVAPTPRPPPAPRPPPVTTPVAAASPKLTREAVPRMPAAPAAPAAALRPSAPSRINDFDATATDIPDVPSFDVPVLMDAVEEPAPPAPAPRAPAAPPPAARTPSAPAPRDAAPVGHPAPASAAAPPPTRPQPEPRRAAPSAPPAAAVAADEDPDLQHQTQTMRALSMAKSIDDVSDSMAETLFGEAELDFMSAALASAVAATDEPVAEAATPRAPMPPPQPTPSTTSEPVDDLMDLFNLGPDAPLELIDDSAKPEKGRPRKTAASRG